MKFLILICAVFHMFLFTSSFSDTNTTFETSTLLNSTNLAKPGCDSRCGNLIVPYPFGIGTNCSMDDGFTILCSTAPKASFNKDDYSSIKFISDSTVRLSNMLATRCYNTNGSITRSFNITANYTSSPYTISSKNKFIVIGSHDFAWLTSRSPSRNISTGCMVFCSDPKDVVGGDCSGNGCCQSTIPKDIKYYDTKLKTLGGEGEIRESTAFNPCTYAFLGDADEFKFNGASDLNDPYFENTTEAVVSIVLDWAIGNVSCDEAMKKKDCACQANSFCNSTGISRGYRCICNQGYEGNPYLTPGCQDVNECEDSSKYPCYGDCINTLGNYNCTCPLGSIGDAKKENGCTCPLGAIGDPKKENGCTCPLGSIGDPKKENGCTCPLGSIGDPKKENGCTCPLGSIGDPKKENGCEPDVAARGSTISPTIYIIIAMLFVLLAILSGAGICLGIKRRNLIMLREKFFEQNGGVLLKQKINLQGSHEAMTLFSPEQLLKATNNYSQENIIGRGAYGVVYKGVLSDKRVVAVKKSKLVDVTQAEQFINEVLILTQVIHRNVVKLLGCCLEEEVPVLVYEFISNNTLFHHIHNRPGGMSWLSWDHRLRIAIEAAGALAYLHSETIMPIVHRDVKSSNILLDSKYTAKISDFGASRLVPLDHEQVTTLIQGTLGYLDPEYYHTSQLTEKSDVYSFGVVLAELITGKRPIGVDRANKEKNLATYFVNSINENRLNTILEPRILREGSLDQLQAVVDLIKRCLNLQGHHRPTMKEVVVELDGVRKFTTHPWVHKKSCGKTTSQVLEVEQHDLYEEVPLVSFSTNECESYSATYMTFEEESPR